MVGYSLRKSQQAWTSSRTKTIVCIILRNQWMVRITICNLVPAEADFLTWDDLCPLSGHSADKWKRSLSQQMSTRYIAVFTEKVVRVDTEEVQASNKNAVSGNSPSLKQNHTEVAGRKPQDTYSLESSVLLSRDPAPFQSGVNPVPYLL